MNVDFSTITPVGAVTLIILLLLIVGFLVLMGRNLNKLKIKTERLSIETEKQNKEMKETIVQSKEEHMNVTRDIVKKQSNLAKHHIMAIAGDLRELFFTSYDLNEEEKDKVWLLVALFTSEFKYQVLNNFTENHIGHNDSEIEQYTSMRAREYNSFIVSFFDEHDSFIERYRLKDALVKLPHDYFFSKLFTIYKDGKAIEKQMK